MSPVPELTEYQLLEQLVKLANTEGSKTRSIVLRDTHVIAAWTSYDLSEAELAWAIGELTCVDSRCDGDPPIQTGWLIETFIGSNPLWWTGDANCDAWSVDSKRAIRFVRKQDADAMIQFLKSRPGQTPSMVATEHQWE